MPEWGAPPPAPSTPAKPTVPGFTAKIVRGVAYAPSYAPLPVQEAIWAGNKIRHKPYIFGGGHGAFIAAGYDCSGSVSYVLHAAGLLATPFDSSESCTGAKADWATGSRSTRTRVTRSSQIAGIPLDTSAEASAPGQGLGPALASDHAVDPRLHVAPPLGYSPTRTRYSAPDSDRSRCARICARSASRFSRRKPASRWRRCSSGVEAMIGETSDGSPFSSSATIVR